MIRFGARARVISAVVVACLAGARGTRTPVQAAAPSPYTGTAVSIPGTIQAANYDIGGEGVAYHDATSGNSGGAYRQDDVDVEPSAEGGYDIGWIAAGEWLNYTVSVPAAGSYTAQIRLASPSGGALHLGFNTSSNVWKAVTVPATGGWQAWTTVSVPVTLGAGGQLMTLLFDTSGLNIAYVKVVSASGGGGTPRPVPTRERRRRCPARLPLPTSTMAARAPRTTTRPPATAVAPIAPRTWTSSRAPRVATTSGGRPPASG